MFISISGSPSTDKAVSTVADRVALSCLQHAGLGLLATNTGKGIAQTLLETAHEACEATKDNESTIERDSILSDFAKSVHSSMHSQALLQRAESMGLGKHGETSKDGTKDKDGKALIQTGIRTNVGKAMRYFDGKMTALNNALEYTLPVVIGTDEKGNILLETFSSFEKRANKAKKAAKDAATNETPQEALATRCAQFGQYMADALRGTANNPAGLLSDATVGHIRTLLNHVQNLTELAMGAAHADTRQIALVACYELETLAEQCEGAEGDEAGSLPEGAEVQQEVKAA